MNNNKYISDREIKILKKSTFFMESTVRDFCRGSKFTKKTTNMLIDAFLLISTGISEKNAVNIIRGLYQIESFDFTKSSDSKKSEKEVKYISFKDEIFCKVAKYMAELYEISSVNMVEILDLLVSDDSSEQQYIYQSILHRLTYHNLTNNHFKLLIAILALNVDRILDCRYLLNKTSDRALVIKVIEILLHNKSFDYEDIFQHRLICSILLLAQIKEKDLIIKLLKLMPSFPSPKSDYFSSCMGLQQIFRRSYSFSQFDLKYHRIGASYIGSFTYFGLMKKYDAVIVIAKQGLRHAFYADLAKIPIVIVNAHDHMGEKIFECLTPDIEKIIKGKKVLILENDIVTGNTLDLVLRHLYQYRPKQTDILLTESGFSNYESIPKRILSVLDSISSFVQRIYFDFEMLSQPMDDETAEFTADFLIKEAIYERKTEADLSLKDRVISLEDKLKKVIEDIEKSDDINQEDKKTLSILLHSSFYKVIYALISSPFEDPIFYNSLVTQLSIIDSYFNLLEDKKNFNSLSIVDFNGLIHILNSSSTSYYESVAENIFRELAEQYFSEYYQRVQNPDTSIAKIPHNIFEIIKLSKDLIKRKGFDIVLVIGPEGGKYAAPFKLAGFEILEIHIDDFNPDRPYQELNDLSIIKGKRVLMLEDDVNTGATLKKALEHILPYNPKSLGLFLGNPEYYQNTANIPRIIKKVYQVKSVSEKEKRGLIDWFLGLVKR